MVILTCASRGSARPPAISVLALVCALICQSIAPYPASAVPSSFDALASQLTDLVSQRTSTLSDLNVADGIVGAAVARDVLGALQPSLTRQAQLFGDFEQELAIAAEASPTATETADRSTAPGVLLGPHLALPAPQIPYQPLEASRPGTIAWRESLLEASSLRIAPPSRAEAAAAHSATAVGTVGALSILPGGAAPPPAFAKLGAAADFGPPRQIELEGLTVPISAVAPQVVPAPDGDEAITTTVPPAQHPAHGPVVIDAIVHVSLALPALVNKIAVPPRLSSVNVLASQPITGMSSMLATLGSYALPASGTGAVGTPTAASSSLAGLLSVTWTYTQTAPMSGGTTLLTVGTASSYGGSQQGGKLSAYQVLASPPVAPITASATLALAANGDGTFELVVPISTTTTLTAQATVRGLLGDSTIRDGLQREHGLLTRLGDILQRGNAVYSAIKPLYDSRLAVYNTALSAAVSRNSIIEQAWWDRTAAWTTYQGKLTAWKARKSAWDYFVKHGVAPPTVTATGTAVSGQTRTGVQRPTSTATMRATPESFHPVPTADIVHRVRLTPAPASSAEPSRSATMIPLAYDPISPPVSGHGPYRAEYVSMEGAGGRLDPDPSVLVTLDQPGQVNGDATPVQGTVTSTPTSPYAPALSPTQPTPWSTNDVPPVTEESNSPTVSMTPVTATPAITPVPTTTSEPAQDPTTGDVPQDSPTTVQTPPDATSMPDPDPYPTDSPSVTAVLPVDGSSSDTATAVGEPAPSATDTPDSTFTPTATDTASSTATQTATTIYTATLAATASGTALVVATATSTPLPSATATSTPLPSATATSTPLPSATAASTPLPSATATSTPLPSATASNTPTPIALASDTATQSATDSPTAPATASATSTASATVTPTLPRPTSTRAAPTSTPPVPTPGKRPLAVPAPGPEPATEPLPLPLPPLPGWVTLPISFSTAPASFMLDNDLAANGYGKFTQQQLIDAGVMENVTGYLPPVTGVITTLFGGVTPFQSYHTGLDIAAPDGTPVHAAAGGIVVHAGLAVPGQPTQSYGNCVVIMHNSHTVTIYGHMQLGAHDLQVRVGEVVSQGQILGYEGATGWATGPHVHFEMRINNVAFDPLLLVNESQVTGSGVPG